jgi:GT2 family glycosyltransferase
MNKIAAIVVTYNRQECLVNCLEAIRRQTLSPNMIYIVDNHSTSNTAEMLLANKIISIVPEMNISEDVVITSQINSLSNLNDTILIKYIYKSENTGSGGGLYTGMKTAFDDGHEWFWLMDDDGFPAESCVEQLVTGAKKYSLDYANALVVNIEDKFSLSFKGKTNIDDYRGVDVVYDTASPWNSTFIHRSVPEKIGFIKKEMFIWGDETEYFLRTLKNGFNVATITKSIHYHPASKTHRVGVFPFLKKPTMGMLRATMKNRSHIYYRNKGYIGYTYRRRSYLYKIFLAHLLYFILRLRFVDCRNFIIAYINGCKNKFDK